MITLEDLNRQAEIQAMYRDDKFAAKLKELQAQYKSTQDAQKALDARQKQVTADEKLCEVIQASQAEFNRWKSAEETKITDRRAKAQTAKDAATAELKNAKADRADATEYKIASEGMLQDAETKRKSAQNKDNKAAKALEKAEEYKALYAAKLETLGLKAA